mmetsp:Transcript_13682/g.34515  ORF Transcript_13682/g.34515 Transcript_13682/m.34515 type:complete len:385 (+) Transcript_13682:1551-2705(+)
MCMRLLEEGHVVVGRQGLHANLLLVEPVETVGVLDVSIVIVVVLVHIALLVLVPVVRFPDLLVARALEALLAELPSQAISMDFLAKVKNAVEGVPAGGGHMRGEGSHVRPRHHVRVVEGRSREAGKHDGGVGILQPVAQVLGLFRLGARAAQPLWLVFRRPHSNETARIHAQQLSKVLLLDMEVVHDAHGGAAPHILLMLEGGCIVQTNHRIVRVDDGSPLCPLHDARGAHQRTLLEAGGLEGLRDAGALVGVLPLQQVEGAGDVLTASGARDGAVVAHQVAEAFLRLNLRHERCHCRLLYRHIIWLRLQTRTAVHCGPRLNGLEVLRLRARLPRDSELLQAGVKHSAGASLPVCDPVMPVCVKEAKLAPGAGLILIKHLCRQA